MYFRRLALAMAVAAATLPAAALAQDAKPTKLTTDFGYVQTSGNTDVTTFTGADKLEHRMSTWLLTQEANAVWGETDGVESAGRWGPACERIASWALTGPPMGSRRGGATCSRASRASSMKASGSLGMPWP